MAIEKQKAADKKITNKYWKNKEERYQAEKDKIDNFIKETDEQCNSRGNEIIKNITDPDCRMMKNDGKITESYNGQISACGKNSIIIATEISNEANEYNLFNMMTKRIEENCPNQEKLKKTKYLYDRGYYTVNNLVEAYNKNMNVYIADKGDRNIYDGSIRKRKSNTICIKDCKIKKHKDFYAIVCPGGLKLTEYKISKSKGNDYYVFAVSSQKHKGCEKCKVYENCKGIKKPGNVKYFSIRKESLDYKEIVDRHKKKRDSETGKRTYSRRMAIIESVFAQIKSNMGFTKFLRRGIKKVKTEWIIACLARISHHYSDLS